MITQLWAKQMISFPAYRDHILSFVRQVGEMGVDTLRQSLLLSQPQNHFEWCHTPKTVLMTTELKLPETVIFHFPQCINVLWLFFISTAQWSTLHVCLTLFQPTFRFASSTYRSLHVGQGISSGLGKTKVCVHWMIIAWFIFLKLCMY